MTAKTEHVTISAPNMQTAEFKIRGRTQYVQSRFSKKVHDQMREHQEAGNTTKKGKKREPKDFEENYKQSMYESDEGWRGIPAATFRNAAISACRIAGFVMTRAKLSVFCEADGFDATNGTALVKITKGEPEMFIAPTRNATGVVDLRSRAMWRPGWEAVVRIRFDADQFTLVDVTNLMVRVGLQVGIGEGRHDSKKSCGMGWGEFEVVE